MRKKPFFNFSYGPYLWVAINKDSTRKDVNKIRQYLASFGFQAADRYKGMYKATRTKERMCGLALLKTAMLTTLSSNRVRKSK